jgi:hypothetical protein
MRLTRAATFRLSPVDFIIQTADGVDITEIILQKLPASEDKTTAYVLSATPLVL